MAVLAAESSSVLEPLLPPDMFNMAEVAAVNGCSKNLNKKGYTKNVCEYWKNKMLKLAEIGKKIVGLAAFYLRLICAKKIQSFLILRVPGLSLVHKSVSLLIEKKKREQNIR